MKNTYFTSLLQAYLNGYGQILLQSDYRSGILVLSGILYGSWIEGLAAMTGGMVGLATARAFRFPPDKIAQGLYGFNAALVSVALTHFFGLSPLLAGFLILGSFLSTLLMHLGLVCRIPPYTFPFILITWLVCLFSPSFTMIAHSEKVYQVSYILLSIPYGMAQVVLQGNIISGCLFFLAILIHSRVAALFALGGVLAGTWIACIMGMPSSQISTGVFGYCSVLCALAWVGTTWYQALFAFLGVLISCLLLWLMLDLGIQPLTFPFVVSTWMLLLWSYASSRQHIITHIHKL
jgi:urea transporter